MCPAPILQSLADRVTGQLRRRLVDGEFVPGQHLSEAALTTSLQVSRNTLREALRLLIKEGLLTYAPNRGVSVAVPSVAAVIDIYRVRRLVECQALSQAYPRHPAHKNLRLAVEQAIAHREAADWRAVGTANLNFHMAIVELADSERLNAMFSNMLAELRLVFGLLRDLEFMHEPYVSMNARILDLTEAGRLAEAATALNDYLVHSERIVLGAYARRLGETAQDG